MAVSFPFSSPVEALTGEVYDAIVLVGSQRSAKPFIRIKFTDGTIVSTTAYTIYSTTRRRYRITIPESCNGKFVSEVKIGVYLGLDPTYYYKVDLLITDTSFYEGYVPAIRTLSKLSTSGNETQLFNLDSISGYPSFWEASYCSYVKYLRLIGGDIIYPLDGYNEDWYIIFYSGSGVFPTVFQAIMW